MAEIPFPSFTDKFGLTWPRTESVSMAWAHPGQRYHPTPGEASGVLVSRAEGFWTGVLQIHALPKYVVDAGLGEQISMWAAQLDIQANTTRIPHKRHNLNFLRDGDVALGNRRVSSGIWSVAIGRSQVKAGLIDSDNEIMGIHAGTIFALTRVNTGVTKRIVRSIAVPSFQASQYWFTLFPNFKLSTSLQRDGGNSTTVRIVDSIHTRAINDRPIIDPRTPNHAGPWVYAWQEVLG